MRASVKIIISLVVVLVVLLATFAGVYLIRERQLFSKKASTPAGQATISLSPATASIPVNLSQVVTIYLDPAGLPISGVSARIKFEYSCFVRYRFNEYFRNKLRSCFVQKCFQKTGSKC